MLLDNTYISMYMLQGCIYEKAIIFIIGLMVCINLFGCSKPNTSDNEEENIKRKFI